MLHGVVVKAYSGFYYVEIEKEVWECRLRGKFRLTKQNVLAGDRVNIKQTGAKTGVIEEILPRKTELDRPQVANVDQVVIAFACKDPDPQTELLDRILIQAEAAGLKQIICFNKIDLLEEPCQNHLAAAYEKAGYCVLTTSTRQNIGIDKLYQRLYGLITVFAGPSGSGKSSLLNALGSNLRLKTGDVSEKIGRGKHTTRFAQLIELEPGTLVVDSPGFSSLYMPNIKKQDLAELFPEFLPYLDTCKFNGCLHRAEPECAVKQAVQENQISQDRYNHYLLFLQELIEREGKF